MAKKAASKKTSPTAPELADLVGTLRLVADDLERLSPIVDLKVTGSAVQDLEKHLVAWIAEVKSSLLLPEDAFAAIQPAWAEIWSLAKASVVLSATAQIGDAAKVQKPEKDVDHRGRVLLALLQKGGEDLAQRVIADARTAWETGQKATPDKPSHVSDKEANDLLKAWGRLTEAEFLAAYKTIPVEQLKRAGAVIGQKIGKPTVANMKALYKAAHRFAVNTAS